MEGRRVRFECECSWTRPGQWVGVVGSSPALGNWDLTRCIQLRTSSSRFPLWDSREVCLPALSTSSPEVVEFKFIVAEDPQTPQQTEQDQQPWTSPSRKQPVGVVWEALQKNRALPTFPSHVLCRCVFGQEEFSTQALSSSSSTAPSSPVPLSVAAIREGRSLSRHAGSPLQPLKFSDSAETDFSPLSVNASPSSLPTDSAQQQPPFTEDFRVHFSKNEEEAFLSRLQSSLALEALVSGNRKASSWREKLLVVRGVLHRQLELLTEATCSALEPRRDATDSRLGEAVDALAFIGVYLDFINQSIIKCKEDGRHFRPNHHARLSQEVNLLVLQIIQSELQAPGLPSGLRGRDELASLYFAARSVPLALPSFSAAFQVAAPLTRIRNIAHRDDIPRELKLRIKSTLQNKIHRCAGPEDLVAAKVLLRELLDEGGSSRYSKDFISEFVLFVKELTAFFKQDDLEERLGVLRQLEDSRVQEAIDRFLDAKQRSDFCKCNSAETHSLSKEGTAGLECLCGGIQPVKMLLTMRLATDLRRTFCMQVEEGLAQRGADELNLLNKRIAELQLEGSVFVYTSRVANCAQRDRQRQLRLTEALEALYIGVTNLEISGIWREECRALQRELLMHCRADLSSDVAQQLLFSTVKRVNDLCVELSDLLHALYIHRARVLRDSLLAAPFAKQTSRSEKCQKEKKCFKNAVVTTEEADSDGLAADLKAFQCNVYAEGKVRSSLLFQLSRLTQFLLKQMRDRLSLPQLDVLVPGEAVGRVSIFNSLEEGAAHIRRLRAEKQRAAGVDPSGHQEVMPFILCVEKATGDEEVCGLGEDEHGIAVASIVVAHDLPLLSHLGVRARQEGIPFVACSEPAAFSQFLNLRDACAVVSALFEGAGVQRVDEEFAKKKVEARRRTVAKIKSPETLKLSAKNLEQLVKAVPVERYPLDHAEPPPLLRPREMSLSTCGSKAFSCGRIEILAEEQARRLAPQAEGQETEKESGGAATFHSPTCACLPFGAMEWTIASIGKQREFNELLDALEAASPDDESLTSLCSEIQSFLQQLPLSETIQNQVVSIFGPKARLAIRSSANSEDLKGHSAAGLYDSVINIAANDPVYVQSAVGTVWASLFSPRAVLSRKAANLRQTDACMAVLLQSLVLPALSFVLNTGGLFGLHCDAAKDRSAEDGAFKGETEEDAAKALASPLSDRGGAEVFAEVAPGLGEILASAKTRGSGYRLLINKKTGAFKMLSASTFASVTLPVIPRSRSFSTLREAAPAPRSRRLRQAVYDQTADSFAQDAAFRETTARGIAALSVALEKEFGCPQDVEGVISPRGTLFVVQSRPQA